MTTIALRNGLIVPDSDADPAHAAVIIREGTIESVQAEPTDAGPERSIDLNGRAVIPGLMDVHLHLSSASLRHVDELGVTASDLVPFAAYAAGRRLLDAGFTCVRDVGAQGSALFALRAAAAHGLLEAPRLVLSGQILSVTSIGSRRYGAMYDIADGPEALRAAVRRQVSRGADLIKVMADGTTSLRYDEVDRSEITPEELKAILDEAHRMHRPVACHVEGAGLEVAATAGVQSIEHAPSAHRSPAALAAMAENDTVLVPTLATYEGEATSSDSPKWLRERSKRILEDAVITVGEALRAGVRIASGSDEDPGTSSRRELQLLGEAGLNSRQVLGAATEHSARACGLGDKLGRIHPGRAADLVVLDTRLAPTIDDLGRPDRVWAVLVGGRLLAGTPEARAAFARDAAN